MNKTSDHEQRRLAALARYDVMDTPREDSFDEIAALAAKICDVPMAVVNLIGDERQFFKAEVGLGVRSTPLESSFCAKAILEEDFLLVPDATEDSRFDCNPLVVGAPHIRFYAGALLKSEEGLPIGTLCTLDIRPRQLTELHQQTLRVLARQVMAQLELRRSLVEREQQFAEASANEQRLRLILDSALDYAIITTDHERRITSWSAGAQATFQWSGEEAIGRCIDDLFTPEDRAAGVPAQEVHTAAVDGCAPDIRWHMRADGARVFMNGSTHPIRVEGAETAGFLKIARNETLQREQTEDLARTRVELVDSEARFRNMADNAPVMMWVTDETGYCNYLNRRWYEFTGQTEEEALGIGWTKATHPDDQKMAEETFLAAVAAQSPYRIEFRLRRADGVYRWAIDTAAPRFAATGEFLGHVGSVVDIDERREAEERLALSEEQLRLALDVAEIGQWDVDTATNTMFWPPRVKAMFGISPDVPVTLGDFFSGVHPDDRESTRAAYEAASDPSRRALYDVEYRTIGKEDGITRWVAAKGRGLFNAQGVCYRVIGTAIDVTTRKADEVLLRELNDSLEAQVSERTADRDRMWRLSTDLMLVARYDATITAVNPAWTNLLGWTQDELLGRPFVDLVHPEDVPATLNEAAKLSEGQTTLRFENRYQHKDGSYSWLSWTAVPGNGLIHAVARNISAEKEQAEALQQTEEALRQAQKMEAVGQLTGGIAHDFNNLLTGVIGSLDMMQRRMAKGETDKIERYATTAMTAANRAAALTHRLLAFSRRQPLDPKPVNANRLVTGMEELLRRTLGESVQLEIVTAGGLWQTLCDPHQLESAILNLAINARDAMPDGGQLTIETCNAALDSAYAAKSREVRPGQYICICVTDTGTGMSEGVIAKAFEPFFTTKPIGQGTGLGLSMIYGFARQSEGYAKIYSEEGKGTTFKLYLPRYYGQGEEAEDATGSLTDEHRSQHGETVLVVEDESAVRDLVVDVLEELGYRAIEAVDGPSGLKLLQSDQRIDLLVSDVGLPGLNGRQLADQAREKRPDLKVLFMTGYAENATIANGFLEPGMQMITKPFAIEALATRIRDMIEARAIM